MAAEAAKLAAARSDSPEESRYASYIAASAQAFPGDTNQERLQEGSDIWAALSADHVRAEELESEINERKTPSEY